MRYNGERHPLIGRFPLPLRTLRCLLWGWGRNELGLRAAALTYYAVFSLFPLALVLVTVTGLVWRSAVDQQRLVELFMALFPHEAEAAVRAVEHLSWGASAASIAAGVSLLWSASGYVRLLLATIDRIHARTTAARRRTWWLPHALGTAAVMLVTPVLLLGLTVGSTLVHLLATLHLPNGKPLVNPWLVNTGLFLGAVVLALYLALQYIPAERGPRRVALRAAAFTALGWLAAGQALRQYLHSAWAHYNIVYGPLASVIVLMFYLYIINVVLLVGAQLHAIWCGGAACQPPPLPKALRWLERGSDAAQRET